MISASRFYAILNSLKKKGYLKEYSVNFGYRGGMSTFLEITPSGCDAIGVRPKPHLTRGGNFITDIFAIKLSEHLKEIIPNSKISIEKQIQGKWIDIVIEGINQPFVIGIELELSDINLKSNIGGAEKTDFLIEACINEQIMNRACEIVKDLPIEKQNRVAICSLTKLLRCEKLSKVVDSQVLKERNL